MRNRRCRKYLQIVFVVYLLLAHFSEYYDYKLPDDILKLDVSMLKSGKIRLLRFSVKNNEKFEEIGSLLSMKDILNAYLETLCFKDNLTYTTCDGRNIPYLYIHAVTEVEGTLCIDVQTIDDEIEYEYLRRKVMEVSIWKKEI